MVCNQSRCEGEIFVNLAGHDFGLLCSSALLENPLQKVNMKEHLMMRESG